MADQLILAETLGVGERVEGVEGGGRGWKGVPKLILIPLGGLYLYR